MDRYPVALTVFERLKSIRIKGDLGEAIAAAVSGYTLHDLQEVRRVIEAELRHLPPQYRRLLLPKMREEIFGAHHRLMVMARKREFSRMRGPVREGWEEFCDRVQEVISEEPQRKEGFGSDPVYTTLYYLLSAFVMFVLEEPGHPPGTPFPGGLKVEKKNGQYFCPIRDKEEDVRVSICPWCPAVQTPGV
ncbi:MAG: DUF2115 domain-containing protein [Methanoculleaceae archaeon]